MGEFVAIVIVGSLLGFTLWAAKLWNEIEPSASSDGFDESEDDDYDLSVLSIDDDLFREAQRVGGSMIDIDVTNLYKACEIDDVFSHIGSADRFETDVSNIEGI